MQPSTVEIYLFATLSNRQIILMEMHKLTTPASTAQHSAVMDTMRCLLRLQPALRGLRDTYQLHTCPTQHAHAQLAIQQTKDQTGDVTAGLQSAPLFEYVHKMYRSEQSAH